MNDALTRAERDRATRAVAQSEFRTPLIIEAGAGTGKTALLVARVAAWCLGDGWERHAADDRTREAVARRVIERVTAITFTDAAAADPTGAATDGEVEDYQFTITAVSELPVDSLNKIGDGIGGGPSARGGSRRGQGRR